MSFSRSLDDLRAGRRIGLARPHGVGEERRSRIAQTCAPFRISGAGEQYKVLGRATRIEAERKRRPEVAPFWTVDLPREKWSRHAGVLGREDSQMPRSYPLEVRRQVIELARAGTRVSQLSLTFGMTEATIYNWLRQDRVDRGRDAGSEHRAAAGSGRGEATDPSAGDRAGRRPKGDRGVPTARGSAPKGSTR